MWDRIAAVVKEQLPKFNDKLLTQYRETEVSKAIEYVDTVFKEATRMFHGEIRYLGYEVLSPKHRLEQLETAFIPFGFNVQRTELSLVRFDFQYNDEKISSFMYLPYMVDGAIIIDDTSWHIQIAEMERVFSRIRDGLTAKVLRSPLFFQRTEQLPFTSTKGVSFCEAVITTIIHSKSGKKNRRFKTALMLYFLSTFGLYDALAKFDIAREDLIFTDKEDPTLMPDWHEFKIKDNLFLQVKSGICEDITKRRVIASLLYCLKPNFAEASLDRIVDPDGTMWKILLGKSIFGVKNADLSAHQYTVTHLDSLSTYLDYFTKSELAILGIECNDIFEFLILVFKNINSWLFNHQPNNLYEKKVGVLELLMSDISKSIFHRCYNNRAPNQQLSRKDVKALLGFRGSSRKIDKIYECGAAISASVYGDNALLFALLRRVRQPINLSTPKRRKAASRKQTGNLIHAPEFRFDPSFLVVESILAMSSSSPGTSGLANPFCPITEKGGFYKPDYAEDLDILGPYLPRR